ncbi:hypothetical protein [Nocardioides aromaticivorans]|uniref:hypothetical protein n=1 Tax=Nocardioides aromaticivorans TaxID=200618 RepID=UPI001A8BFED1|nr:hypothetical protein [Nocardioides aromaticivorans]
MAAAFGLPETRRLLQYRTLTASERQTLGDALGLDVAGWSDGHLPEQLGTAFGDPRTGAASRDPLGWALTHFSVRCPSCHDQNEPWDLHHQTGLAWTCRRHGRPLEAACGACNPRIGLLLGSPLKCLHHRTPRNVTAPDEDAQLEVSLRAMMSSPDEKNTAALRTLRALTAFVTLDLVLSPNKPGDRNEEVAQRLQALHRRVRRSGRGKVGLRLERPAHEPWVNAHLVARASRHLDRSTGLPDSDWISSVARKLDRSDFPMHRIESFTEHLGMTSFGRREVQEVDPQWLRLADESVLALRRRGITAAHIPSFLSDPPTDDLLTGHWAPGLARSVVLRQALTGEATTRIVTDLGHHFTHVTQVRRILALPPNDAQRRSFHAATTNLLDGPLTDYAQKRVNQVAVVRVSDHVLRQFRLTPPSGANVSPGQAAALWLWSAVTSSHPVTAAFLDGRTTRPVLPKIRDWQRSADPAQLLGLLSWNDAETNVAPSAPRIRASETRAV